jgi:hypothetical protein
MNENRNKTRKNSEQPWDKKKKSTVHIFWCVKVLAVGETAGALLYDETEKNAMRKEYDSVPRERSEGGSRERSY